VIGSRLFRRDEGQALVEMAIALPLLLLLLIGIVDVALLVNVDVTVTNASREAANYAILHPNAAPAAIASQAIARAEPLHTELITVNAYYRSGATFLPWPISGIPASSPVAQVPVAVEVSYPWSASTILIGQYFGSGTRTMTARSTMVTTW
jgi:Flp pilus assembly protein TadG